MKFFKSLFLFLLIVFQDVSAKDVPFSGEILAYVEEHLPLCGILKNSDQFVYVDLDDAYVYQLMHLIEKECFKAPPYFDGPGLVGAHITVIYPYEMEEYRVQEIAECGERVNFSLKECALVSPIKWQAVDQFYLIVIESPKLDQIRAKYGLPPKKYDFHITIGVKERSVRHA